MFGAFWGHFPHSHLFEWPVVRFGRCNLPRNYCTFVVEVEDMEKKKHSPFIIPPGKYIMAQLPCIGLKGTEIFSYLFHWQFRWLNHPFEQICCSKWVHLQQISGWKFQQYLSYPLLLGQKEAPFLGLGNDKDIIVVSFFPFRNFKLFGVLGTQNSHVFIGFGFPWQISKQPEPWPNCPVPPW